jgi:hypothetical protein
MSKSSPVTDASRAGAQKIFLRATASALSERNLSADADARAEHARIGYRGVPVIRAEGHTIYGFREQALGKLLGIS